MAINSKSLKHAAEDPHQHGNKHDDENIAPPADDESNWLVSYADMMTLLCGFFIMLFSMAKMDEPKYDQFKEEMVKQFGGEYTNPSKELAKHMTQVLKEIKLDSEATVSSDPLGVAVTFESTVFFDTLSADVSDKGKHILQTLISTLQDHQRKASGNYKIIIEGHTDGRPITGGIYPSNWELSSARASRVVRLFLDHGFGPDHLVAIGYADTHPLSPSRTPDGQWNNENLAKNRRVVLRIMQPHVDSIPFPEEPKTVAKTQANTAH